MSTQIEPDAQTAALLHEAAMWRVLGRLFECPDDRWRADITLLTRELHVDDLRTAAHAIDEMATPGQYYSVFGPGGPASPREASYHESLELGSLMSDLAGYYKAFAYAPKNGDPLDHVAVEINFVSYLKFKAACAHAQGHDERAEIASHAASRFIADHLSRIATPLATLLAESHLPYLARASALLAARVGPPPTSTRLPTLPAATEDELIEDFTCGLP